MPSEKRPTNTGRFVVNDQCIYCGLCAEVAPMNFRKQAGEEYAVVQRQPQTEQELLQCEEALRDCPYAAIDRVTE